jgi:hypothetical protein
MTKLGKTLAAAISGTTFMTLFSHMVAEVEQENFSEPLLLSKLLHRVTPALNTTTARIAGWGAHYAVGIAFEAVYEQCLAASGRKPNKTNGLVMGAASGVAGIAAWKLAFKIHPAPPELNYRKFYTQLFFAHLVFGLVAATTYRIIENDTTVEPINKPTKI